MAIQFPPVNVGDPPQDGDTYLYLITQEEFVCHRRSPLLKLLNGQLKGLLTTTILWLSWHLRDSKPAPTDANKGNIYSVIDGGIADHLLMVLLVKM